jgi:cobalt-zinc-cadmium efflux system membrane fusion protein
MNRHVLKLGIVLAALVLATLGGCSGESEHEDADVHDHDAHMNEDNGDHDDHEGHGHAEETHVEDGSDEADEHAGHDHGEDTHEEDVVHLSAKAIGLAGIRIEEVRPATLTQTIELPGEIGFNEDRLVHVTPRYAGVAREVHGRIGAHVREGDLLAVLESNESLSRYNITAPISGRIINKHLTVGEFVAEDHDMFLIADLSTVWANCEVYAKDMPYVRQGAGVTVSAVEGGQSVEARLSYVAPVYSEHKRSALARAVLSNNGDFWRPGTFVRASIPVEIAGSSLTVQKGAVQTLGDMQVVFVPGEEEGEFEIVAVEIGFSSEDAVEIVNGLHEGDAYVATGAFELKAKMVTANLGDHAGHGH